MKLSLVVASGVHQGKVIAIGTPEFLIGRDPTCQLRPASQAISKVHCGLSVRDGQVFVKDHGSTNGTSVNDEMLAPEVERQLQTGDRLKAGPLDFTVQFSLPKPSDATPLPAAMKEMTASAASALKEVIAPKAPAAVSKPAAKPKTGADSDDDMAAMMLGMEDDSPSGAPSGVPEGSTIMEMPAVMADEVAAAAAGEKKAPATREGTANAASEILRRYMRRPR